MKDRYPTRKLKTSKFINRIEPVSYDEKEKFYIKNGFLVIRDFFSEDTIKSALNNSKGNGLITKEIGSNVIRAVTGIHHNEPFKQISETPELLKMVKNILGGFVYIHQSRINYKDGLVSTGWAWHSDFETWHSQDGMPSMRCLTAMIPLTENTECNGSLMVIPKSHHLFYSCPKGIKSKDEFADQKEGVPDTKALITFFENSNNEIVMIKCSPCDLVLFDCNLIHVSTANLSPLPRTNLFLVYNSIENRLINPTRPEEMGATIIEIL